MLTIGRRWSQTQGFGVADCDYCGTPYPLSRLERDSSCRLQCPDDRGMDVVTQQRGDAAAIERSNRRRTRAMDAASTQADAPSWGTATFADVIADSKIVDWFDARYGVTSALVTGLGSLPRVSEFRGQKAGIALAPVTTRPSYIEHDDGFARQPTNWIGYSR